jgi:ferric-dicitrate binding protein FerR (iron transport regulator)
MPDYERLLRKFAIDFAPTEQAKRELAAYHRGQDRARWEVVGVAILVAAFVVFISQYV